MLDQGADVKSCGHGAKGTLYLALSQDHREMRCPILQQAKEMLSKQTTIDWGGRVSRNCGLGGVVV